MSVKFDKLKIGDVLWHITKYKMGNTSMTSIEAISGVVTEIDVSSRTVKIGGRTVPEARLKGYSLSKPLIVYGMSGSGRKATKEENQLWQEGKLDKRTNQQKGEDSNGKV